jgi:cytochrome b subunit of formate dehydrogenase
MSSSAERFDRRARGEFARLGKTRVHRGELLRHPVYTRFLHWSVAISFILSLISGFAIYSPWLFHFLTPVFGGGARTRALHPWFGVVFQVFFLFQFLNWFAPMAWSRADSKFMRRINTTLNRKTPASSMAARNSISGPSPSAVCSSWLRGC